MIELRDQRAARPVPELERVGSEPARITSRTSPSSSSSSSVAECVVAARGASLTWRSASKTVTGKPRWASASAVTTPTGPPPAISTRSVKGSLAWVYPQNAETASRPLPRTPPPRRATPCCARKRSARRRDASISPDRRTAHRGVSARLSARLGGGKEFPSHFRCAPGSPLMPAARGRARAPRPRPCPAPRLSSLRCHERGKSIVARRRGTVAPARIEHQRPCRYAPPLPLPSRSPRTRRACLLPVLSRPRRRTTRRRRRSREPGPIFTSRSGSMPASASMRLNPSTGPGAAPIRRSFTAAGRRASRRGPCAARETSTCAARGQHRACTLPVPERVERRVRGACHEVEPAVAQFLVRPGDGKEQLDRRIEALLPEETQLDRGDRREVRRRDEVGNRETQCVCHVCLAVDERLCTA